MTTNSKIEIVSNRQNLKIQLPTALIFLGLYLLLAACKTSDPQMNNHLRGIWIIDLENSYGVDEYQFFDDGFLFKGNGRGRVPHIGVEYGPMMMRYKCYQVKQKNLLEISGPHEIFCVTYEIRKKTEKGRFFSGDLIELISENFTVRLEKMPYELPN